MMKKLFYEAPCAEVCEVIVEAGFTFSSGINDTEEGDNWGPAQE